MIECYVTVINPYGIIEKALVKRTFLHLPRKGEVVYTDLDDLREQLLKPENKGAADHICARWSYHKYYGLRDGESTTYIREKMFEEAFAERSESILSFDDAIIVQSVIHDLRKNRIVIMLGSGGDDDEY